MSLLTSSLPVVIFPASISFVIEVTGMDTTDLIRTSSVAVTEM
jgi:hypothetical protein